MLKSICVCTLALGLTGSVAALVHGQSAAAHTERRVLPIFELMGMPITAVQVQVVGSAHVRERSATPDLVLEGMPASPHQVAVLTSRRSTHFKAAARTP